MQLYEHLAGVVHPKPYALPYPSHWVQTQRTPRATMPQRARIRKKVIGVASPRLSIPLALAHLPFPLARYLLLLKQELAP